MKRFVSVATSIFQLALLAGILALSLLDKKFMGVMRFLANKNRALNATLWADILPIAVSAVMYVTVCWTIVMMVRYGTKGTRRPWILLAVACFTAGTFVLFTNTTVIRAYWFISIVLVVIVILQAVKSLLCGRENSKQR